MKWLFVGNCRKNCCCSLIQHHTSTYCLVNQNTKKLVWKNTVLVIMSINASPTLIVLILVFWIWPNYFVFKSSFFWIVQTLFSIHSFFKLIFNTVVEHICRWIIFKGILNLGSGYLICILFYTAECICEIWLVWVNSNMIRNLLGTLWQYFTYLMYEYCLDLYYGNAIL